MDTCLVDPSNRQLNLKTTGKPHRLSRQVTALAASASGTGRPHPDLLRGPEVALAPEGAAANSDGKCSSNCWCCRLPVQLQSDAKKLSSIRRVGFQHPQADVDGLQTRREHLDPRPPEDDGIAPSRMPEHATHNQGSTWSPGRPPHEAIFGHAGAPSTTSRREAWMNHHQTGPEPVENQGSLNTPA